MLKTPVCNQGEYKFFFILCYNPSALIYISPTPAAKFHFYNPFCTFSKKQDPPLTNSTWHQHKEPAEQLLCFRDTCCGTSAVSAWSVLWKGSDHLEQVRFCFRTSQNQAVSCWTFKRSEEHGRKGETNFFLVGGKWDKEIDKTWPKNPSLSFLQGNSEKITVVLLVSVQVVPPN